MNDELPGLIDEARAIASEAQKTFGHLSTEQVNWKPHADEWSVAQCFEHLIAINAAYFPHIRKIARGEYRRSLRERLPLLPRLFGSMVLKAVQPGAPRKFKTNPAFQPASSAIDGDIIARFKAHQQEVIEHMTMTENVNLREAIITSPVASLATYSLLGAYKIIVAHERRHMAQAGRVMEQAGFPNGGRDAGR